MKKPASDEVQRIQEQFLADLERWFDGLGETSMEDTVRQSVAHIYDLDPSEVKVETTSDDPTTLWVSWSQRYYEITVRVE